MSEISENPRAGSLSVTEPTDAQIEAAAKALKSTSLGKLGMIDSRWQQLAVVALKAAGVTSDPDTAKLAGALRDGEFVVKRLLVADTTVAKRRRDEFLEAARAVLVEWEQSQ